MVNIATMISAHQNFYNFVLIRKILIDYQSLQSNLSVLASMAQGR